MLFIGELAALATAMCWSFTSVFFAEAGKLIGSFKVNKIRLLVAVLIYCIILLLTTGQLFPENLTREQFFWLGLSGFVGLVIGDGAGFKALVMIGPRLTTLLYSSAPVMTTIIAWFFLGEKLRVQDVIGITITMAGISWVVSERQYKTDTNKIHYKHPDSGTLAKGVFYGLIAALGQATGLVLAKHAMLNLGTTVAPMKASLIRMLTALVIIWIISAFRGQIKQTMPAMKNPKAMLNVLGGAFFGPFLGVWLSLVAVTYIATGVAATLNSMTPIMIIPIVKYIYNENVSLRALVGAIAAIFGIALMIMN